MRRWQTPAEEILWQELRSRKLDGLKFRRQQWLGPYTVDFYCLDHMLIIELDGPIHDAQQAYDAERTGYLESHGCTVLRFPNDEVFTNLSAVLEQIQAAALRLPSLVAAGEGQG